MKWNACGWSDYKSAKAWLGFSFFVMESEYMERLRETGYRVHFDDENSMNEKLLLSYGCEVYRSG